MSFGSADGGRKLPRVHRQLDFELPDGWHGEVVDLSATGLRIQCIAEIPLHTVIEGALKVKGGKTIALKGTVVWSQPAEHRAYVPAEIGLELLDAPDAYLKLVAEIFAED